MLPQYGEHYFDPDDVPIGETLGLLLQQEWNIFSDRLLSTDMLDELLSEIMQATVNVRDLWVAKRDSWYREPDEEWTLWQRFSEHLKTRRRYIPDTGKIGLEDFQERLRSVLENVEKTVKKGAKLYRARTGWRRDKNGNPAPFPVKEMGAPPPNPNRRSGRANPLGISYLYAASTPETAVAEKQPAMGTILSIAGLRMKRDLRIADLSSVQPLESPFGIDFLEYEIRARELLMALSWELSKPVSVDDPPSEYIPSQYLCELILDSGFDGVIYQSGFSEGYNIVLFDVDAARIMRNIRLAKVESVELRIEYIVDIDELEMLGET